MTIAYGTCVGSWDKLRRYVVPSIGDRSLFALSGQTSIAVAYNAVLDAYREYDLDAVVLLHDDLEVIDPHAEAKALVALQDPSVAVVGVCGGRMTMTHTWWDVDDRVGHQWIDTGLLDFGPRMGDVDVLEGSYLVFSPWAIKNISFDTHLPGFHGYDLDIGLQAHRAGKRLVVVDIDTHHHTTVGFKSPESAAQWQRSFDYFRDKWRETQ